MRAGRDRGPIASIAHSCGPPRAARRVINAHDDHDSFALSDGALTVEVSRCARGERDATTQLVAHLAEFDLRRLYLGAGCSSLFAYCREVLGLSEDAAYNRVEAARACRTFPVILEWLVDGSLTVTTVRLLAKLLTAENHRDLLTAARRRGKREVEELIARRFPKPDAPTSVRRVPERVASPTPALAAATPIGGTAVATASRQAPSAFPPVPAPSVQRAAINPLATSRYEIRFAASSETRDKLRVAQDLLRHTVPSGDVAAVVDRALDALIERLARRKLAIVRKPKATPRPSESGSRHVPAAVRRAVWIRDSGRCAFVGTTGHRCRERARLEYHHVKPYAVGGEATVANVQLRCRAHNGYEADLFFSRAPGVGERQAEYAVSREIPSVPERMGERGDRRQGLQGLRSGPVPNRHGRSPAVANTLATVRPSSSP